MYKSPGSYGGRSPPGPEVPRLLAPRSGRLSPERDPQVVLGHGPVLRQLLARPDLQGTSVGARRLGQKLGAFWPLGPSRLGPERGCKPEPPKFGRAKFQAFGRLAPYPVSRYTFCGSKDPIDLDAMLANLTLEEREQRLSPIVVSIRLGPQRSWKLPDGNFGGLGLQPQPSALFQRFV